MKTNVATTRPTSIASVRSKNTVRKKVSNNTRRSPFGADRVWRKCSYSQMFHATTRSTAASADKGT
ncbi:hypothetical protein D3C85_1943530 [compost metagenome]